MESITIKVPVAIKAKLTEKMKDEMLKEDQAKIEQIAVTEEPVVAVPTEEQVETAPTEEPVVEATAKTDAEKLKKRK